MHESWQKGFQKINFRCDIHTYTFKNERENVKVTISHYSMHLSITIYDRRATILGVFQ